MKIEWLVIGVTAGGSPAARAEQRFGGISGIFWPTQVVSVVGEPLYDLKNSSQASKPYLGSLNENKLVVYQCSSLLSTFICISR